MLKAKRFDLEVWYWQNAAFCKTEAETRFDGMLLMLF